MDEAELAVWRAQRLQAAIDKLYDGSLAEFARRFGWKDGSYVGQMLSGKRPISDKFVRKFETDCRLPGWFDPSVEHGSPEYLLLTELLNRRIPQHVLQTFLEAVKQYPLRQRVG